MSVKLHIKKGDMVYVNAGDSKGQQGKVLKVDAQKQRAIVEGVNISSFTWRKPFLMRLRMIIQI